MFHLGIPTTRAGTIVTSESNVIRDVFYDGHPRHERCTIITRISPTFLRFGSFEIFHEPDPETGRDGPSHGLEGEMLPVMLDYCIKNFFPPIWKELETSPTIDRYELFYREVVDRTCRLIAGWQTVGFCHGVMNTDNMSILGLTLDYGPFGFLETFNRDHICNGSDDGGRYSFRNQPTIAEWNLERFAYALRPCLPLSRSTPYLDKFDSLFNKYYRKKIRRKLGLLNKEEGDVSLYEELLDLMEMTGADFTNTFRALHSLQHLPQRGEIELLAERIVTECCSSIESLREMYRPLIPSEKLKDIAAIAERSPHMLTLMGVNAEFLTTHLKRDKKFQKFQSITSEKDFSPIWIDWLQKYEQRLARVVKECDKESHAVAQKDKERVEMMQKANPRFVLRNYIAQNAIQLSERGDDSEVKRVLAILSDPYDQHGVAQSLFPEESTEDKPLLPVSCNRGSTVEPVVPTDLSFYCDPKRFSRRLRVTCSS